MTWGATALLLGFLTGCAAPGAARTASAAAAATPEMPDTARRARIRMELAVSYYQAGQHQVALGEVAQALAAEPTNAEAYNLQGLILMALQDWPAAQASLDRSLALQPGEPNTLHNAGWLQCEQGRYAQGIAALERVMALPRYGARAQSMMAKAMCQRRSGDLAGAEESFFKAHEMDAGNPVIAYHLGDLLFRRQDLERARFYVRRLNNGEYANAESLWLGIRVERAVGDAAAMRQLADQLQRRYPDSKEWQRYEQGAFSG
ncbi:type IV pilus biogenesis/stability protein PilW [Comamonas sp. GB3 AK4-5]|uniref:type IV pilus biogenesis/stability protein PilW n=1 Tax=Comamonas sp. GB3 AK4-5 TaxID=3231487 RepID=UPI00351DFE92